MVDAGLFPGDPRARGRAVPRPFGNLVLVGDGLRGVGGLGSRCAVFALLLMLVSASPALNLLRQVVNLPDGPLEVGGR